MIDVHVLTYSGTRDEWLQKCLDSLASEPCTVRIVTGEEGNVGSGRAQGYALGENGFVSYVDSDDYVLPGVMTAALAGLKQHRAVVTLENWLWGDSINPTPRQRHHLAVYRREDVMPWLPVLHEHPIHCDDLLMRKLTPWQLSFVGYVWRIHAGQGHRRATKAQHERLEKLCG